MELLSKAKLMEQGQIEIPEEMLSKIGNELKSACINGAWLLITKLNDDRTFGDSLQFNKSGSTHLLPKNQLSDLQLKHNDEIKLVYSETLDFIIMQKVSNKSKHEEL